MFYKNKYENKTIWVIGGTSGIGLAMAQKLSAVNGCKVIVSGRSVLQVPQHQQITTAALDVNDNINFCNVVDEILKTHTKVDIILFFAGFYEPMSIDKFDANLAKKILDTNLGSMVNFVQNLPKFYNRCSMVGVVSSVAGYFGMPNSLFYGASKAGLSHLTQSLYIELKKHKIDVKLINPGFVKTKLTDKNNFEMPFIITPQKAADIILKQLPKNRFEIAFPTAFVFILKFLNKIPFKLRSKIFSAKF